MVYLLYPERRNVSEETIMMWASDAYDNGEIDYLPLTLEDAIVELQDIGHITVQRKNF